MVTLNFGTFSKTTVQDGLTAVLKARPDIVNLMARKQKAKGLVPLTTKSGEIMWVHPNIIKYEQWVSSNSKLKGKSCNDISLAMDDDAVTITSLSDSEEEKLTLAAQPATSQPVVSMEGRTSDSMTRPSTRHSS